MHQLLRRVGGRRLMEIGSVSIVIVAVVVTSCSDAVTQPAAETTTSIVEFRESEPSSATTGLTTPANSAERRCMDFAPSGFNVFSRAETVSTADIRNIVVVTPPPTPSSLLLPGHDAAEEAVMCWATDGVATYVQYWVTNNGESKVLCSTRVADSTLPEQIQHLTCV